MRAPPPAAPTRHIPTSPPDGPTKFIPVSPPPHRHISPPPPRYRPPVGPPPPRPAPPTAAPTPPRRADRHPEPATELPWWQTINRDRPQPPPAQPAPPPPPPASRTAGRTAPPPAPQPRTSPESGRSASLWWLTAAAGVCVVIASVALTLSLIGTHSASRVLDITSAQRQVERILRDPVDGYGAAEVSGVVCNGGVNPTIRKDTGFACDAVVDGVPRKAAVVFQDDDGTYAVDRPR